MTAAFTQRGGSGQLSRAVAESLRANGGTILLRREAAKIFIRDGAACGIQLADGRAFCGRVILSNADARVTFRELLGLEHLPGKFVNQIHALRPTPSVFAVFLALDYDPPIAPVTMYRSPDGWGSGLFVPSKADPSLAPPGHHVLTAMVLLPQPQAAAWNRDDPEYRSRKAAFAEEIVCRMETLLPGLRDHILARDAATPATVTRYTGHPDRAIYGAVCGSERSPLPQQTPIRNLYLVGASTWPGGGVEAVVISGFMAANAIGHGNRRSVACTRRSPPAPPARG